MISIPNPPFAKPARIYWRSERNNLLLLAKTITKLRYATVTSWVEHFEKHEGIAVSAFTITCRLKKAKKIGIDARNKTGTVLKNAFYSEVDIHSACSDILRPLPQTDKNGFFEKDGQQYASINTWSKIFSVAHRTIQKYLQQSKINSTEGKDNYGHIISFYSESEINQACSHFTSLPKADESGTIEVGGDRYILIGTLVKTTGFSYSAIKSRIESSDVWHIEGRDKKGRPFTFFKEKELLILCSELLKEHHVSNGKGFIEVDGVKYGTVGALSRGFNVSKDIIRRVIKSHSIKAVKGKRVGGQVGDFYSEATVYKACEYLFQDVDQTDENGCFEKGGVQYRTIYGFSKVIGVTSATIKKKLKNVSIKPIKGRNRLGRILDLYPEPAVREACADLLEKRQKANPKRP